MDKKILAEFGHCRNCRFWDEPSPVVIAICRAVKPDHNEWIQARIACTEDTYACFSTHPDFGCALFHEKETYACFSKDGGE